MSIVWGTNSLVPVSMFLTPVEDIAFIVLLTMLRQRTILDLNNGTASSRNNQYNRDSLWNDSKGVILYPLTLEWNLHSEAPSLYVFYSSYDIFDSLVTMHTDDNACVDMMS